MRNIFDKLASFFRPKPSATEVALNLIPPVIELQLTLLLIERPQTTLQVTLQFIFQNLPHLIEFQCKQEEHLLELQQ